jgi:hypothetical protein
MKLFFNNITMSDLPKQPNKFELEDGTEIEYTVSDESGAYLFDVRKEDGNTIANFAKAAVKLSIQEKKQIKFLFSGRYITINMNTNPPTVDNPITSLANDVNREVFGRSEYETDESQKALSKWIIENQSEITKIANEILKDEPDFTPFDNFGELPTFAAAILDVTANIRHYNTPYEDELLSKLKVKSFLIRGLANKLYADPSIGLLGIFNDYQDALDYIIMVIIRLVKENT